MFQIYLIFYAAKNTGILPSLPQKFLASPFSSKIHFQTPWAVLYLVLETFSIKFFIGNCKLQTTKCHMTTALRSRLQFVVHIWTVGRASTSKWFTARFFATNNCTASCLKVWTRFLYPFAMCLLDFWSRINELLLIFGRLKWCTSTWWKEHGGPKQWK